MGPGFFDGVVEGFVLLLIILTVLAFGIGVGVTACTMKVGHPTIGWAK